MKFPAGKTVFLYSLGFFLCAAPSLAQVNNLPDSGRIEQQIDLPEQLEEDNSLEIPKPDGLTQPGQLSDQTFTLQSLSVEGSTVYEIAELRPLYQEFIGQEITLEELYRIAQKVTVKYREDGYILSLAIVPEQTVEDGNATIQVVEGYIESVEFQDAPPKQQAKIRSFLEKLKKSRPLNVKALERYLLLANDLAGVEVRSILQKGSKLGAAKLLARVQHDSVDPFFELTNRGSAEVGNLRLQAGVIVNSPLGQGESFTFRTATTPENFEELALGGASVQIPVGNDGLKLSFGGTYTEINPGELLRLNDINGRSVLAELGLNYPLIRSRSTNLSIGAGFDYADTRNISDVPNPGFVLSQDRLAVLRLNLSGDKRDASGIFSGGLNLSQGVAGTTPGNATLPLSRAQGSAVFTKVNFNVSRLQKLPANLVGSLQAKAQLTGDSLLVREQFGLGGATFGSAFNPDELLGDYGYGLRAELQRPFFYRGLGRSLTTQPYVFSDFGQVFRHQPTALENGTDTLSSAGFGVRQSFGEELRLAMEVAFPLERSDEPVDYEPRFFFSLTGFF